VVASREPVEPEPSPWRFPPPDGADETGLVCIGGDLEPATLLAAYRAGLFPMPASRRHLGWWSPDPRGVLPLDELRVSRSLRRSLRRYELRVDTAFCSVVEACAQPGRQGGWITPRIVDAYTRLHELGWAHSVEAWSGQHLAGGLYGVSVGGLFAGESMFSRGVDASKVALVGLVQHLRRSGTVLLDVQWRTEHLATLGVVDLPRSRYLQLLGEALDIRTGWLPVERIELEVR
jgi:leucyl/phenylalanyl-tRNA--protein transferase